MQLTTILKQQAAFTTDSGYKVRFSEVFSWVSIEPIDKDQNDDDFTDSVFLQGDEASDFLTEVDDLFEQVWSLAYDTCMNATAAKYIESLI